MELYDNVKEKYRNQTVEHTINERANQISEEPTEIAIHKEHLTIPLYQSN